MSSNTSDHCKEVFGGGLTIPNERNRVTGVLRAYAEQHPTTAVTFRPSQRRERMLAP